MTTKPKNLSPERLKVKVLAICEDANSLGDLISELAPQARDPKEALRLAAKAHEIAVLAVGPALWGRAFEAKP
jgi:hypothetical protein